MPKGAKGSGVYICPKFWNHSRLPKNFSPDRKWKVLIIKDFFFAVFIIQQGRRKSGAIGAIAPQILGILHY